jgi:hypothetical protein
MNPQGVLAIVAKTFLKRRIKPLPAGTVRQAEGVSLLI